MIFANFMTESVNILRLQKRLAIIERRSFEDLRSRVDFGAFLRANLTQFRPIPSQVSCLDGISMFEKIHWCKKYTKLQIILSDAPKLGGGPPPLKLIWSHFVSHFKALARNFSTTTVHSRREARYAKIIVNPK
jgi:hypothetical protein